MFTEVDARKYFSKWLFLKISQYLQEKKHRWSLFLMKLRASRQGLQFYLKKTLT